MGIWVTQSQLWTSSHVLRCLASLPGWFLSSSPVENRWAPTTKALEHTASPKLHSLLF